MRLQHFDIITFRNVISQLLDQPAVINQFLLILVRIAHFKRLASIFSSISRISLAAISNSTLHIDRFYLPRSTRLIRSNTVLSSISRSQSHNEELQSSRSVSATLYIRWNKQNTDVTTSHKGRILFIAVWNASAKRSYANEPRRN